MDSAPSQRAQILPFPSAPQANPEPPRAGAASRPLEVIAAWPPSAQFAGVFLFGALTALLAVHSLTYLRSGAQPSEIDGAHSILYRVDLNEARRAELAQLPGIGPSLADRIEEYRRTHGGFRTVDELLKVKGIGPTVFERVRPFVVVAASPKNASLETKEKNAAVAKSPAPNKLASLAEPIDVNRATLAELQKLPGIGPKLSQRIVDVREKRPFASISELRRVSGIGPKTLEKVQPYVTIGEPEK